MEDETKAPFEETKTTEVKTSNIPASHVNESRIFGVTVRGILVTLVVITVCVMSYMAKKVEEPLYTIASLTIGYYFGQNQNKQKQ